MSGWTLDPQLRDDSHPVAMLALCEVRLMDDAHYPWLILVPRIEGAVEVIDLPSPHQQALWSEVALAARALRNAASPDKLNIATLGNLVPQLHVHVIARHRTDPAWPAPVWGAVPPKPYPAQHLKTVVDALRGALDHGLTLE